VTRNIPKAWWLAVPLASVMSSHSYLAKNKTESKRACPDVVDVETRVRAPDRALTLPAVILKSILKSGHITFGTHSPIYLPVEAGHLARLEVGEFR
jgi:hypothetical protein